MSSSGTLPRASADEALAAILVDHRLVEAELLGDVRAALADEPNGMGLIAALLDAGAVPRESVALVVADLERGVLSCPGCGGRFNIGKLPPGTRFKCKSCGAPVRVPAARITRAVLGGATPRGGEVSIEEAPVETAAALSEDALDAVLSGGTADGQLLDFSNVDTTPEPSARPRSERPRRASKREAGAVADDDGEITEEHAEPADPHFWKRFVILVVIPIIVMVLGMVYTRQIKTFLFGAPAEDSGEFSVQDTMPRRRSGTAPPATPIEQSAHWKAATAAGEAALELLKQARAAVSAGDHATAVGHFDAAGAKFQEAFDEFDEVHGEYGGAVGALQARVDAWASEREKADAERQAASGG